MRMTELTGLSTVRHRLLGVWRRLRQAAKTEVYAFWRRRPVRPAVVMYESFAGNGMLCNPEAIFRALLTDPEYSRFTHIWVLASKRENPAVVREFRGSSSVRFVRPDSFAYFRALATSGFLVNNATFPPEFGKRAGQKYLNTWHGSPLKRMGYDIGDPANRVANVVRNLLSADFLVSASPYMTEQLYEKAHLLAQIYRGKIIEAGYPRIDRQFMNATAVAQARAGVEERGVIIGNRQVILYAPTWKGTSFSLPEDDISDLMSRIEQLESLIDTQKYVVLLKTHQVVHRYAPDIPGLSGRLIPNEIPSNVILAIADVLITDYSSIFFDFLATGRPIFFLTPDLADYAGYRGFYIEPAEWPGPVVDTVEHLAEAINDFDRVGVNAKIAAKYRKMQSRFVAQEDGHATQRVVDIVFRGDAAGYTVASVANDGRRTILINAGSMRPNGITSALLGLLDGIDHTRFDVSVIFPPTRARSVLDQQRKLNPRVRQFARVGGMNGSKFALARLRATAVRLTSTDVLSARRKTLWHDEWIRCFGATIFDFAIDFSGNSWFWAMLMLQAPDSRHSIWLHDDRARVLSSERLKRSQRADEVARIIALYGAYEHLVSTSSSLNEINSLSLADFAGAEKFSAARSLVGGARILADASAGTLSPQLRGGELPAPAWMTDTGSVRRDRIFASLGRLSVENDTPRLLRAFAALHAAAPNARLMVMGEGPLAHTLSVQIASLGLTGAVWLAGYRSNPFVLLRQSDCVVFTGRSGGEPSVIMEARVLGLPVVTVAYGNGDHEEFDGVLEVAAGDDALTEGMVRFIDGELGGSSVDWVSQNDAAIAAFYQAVGALTPQ